MFKFVQGQYFVNWKTGVALTAAKDEEGSAVTVSKNEGGITR